MVQFLSINFFSRISSIFVGFFKVPVFLCHPVHILQCMLERTDPITNEVLEPITFVLAYPTAYR